MLVTERHGFSFRSRTSPVASRISVTRSAWPIGENVAIDSRRVKNVKRKREKTERVARGCGASRCRRCNIHARNTVTLSIDNRRNTANVISPTRFYECAHRVRCSLNRSTPIDTVRIVSVISKRFYRCFSSRGEGVLASFVRKKQGKSSNRDSRKEISYLFLWRARRVVCKG